MSDKHEHGCDCGCEGEELNTITLEFDDGDNIECEPLGIFEFEGKDYCALVPVAEGDEGDGGDEGDVFDDVFIFEYKEDGDEFELLDIEDDDLFERVADAFEKILEESDMCEEE